MFTDFQLCNLENLDLETLKLKRMQGQTEKESSVYFWGHRKQTSLSFFHTRELILGCFKPLTSIPLCPHFPSHNLNPEVPEHFTL